MCQALSVLQHLGTINRDGLILLPVSSQQRGQGRGVLDVRQTEPARETARCHFRLQRATLYRESLTQNAQR
ncbi:hypothetical protein KOW79_016862 [Hemibagrus wyckioides]|uniref:Uncharacterized protein n=1 Tax=Hemibagrus wyckioides TaxID=337641 RepID=A0A9D3NC48_9TELE|nr:hypothetical protein KOW79_016862 [Hemibagrus wyckioides]